MHVLHMPCDHLRQPQRDDHAIVRLCIQLRPITEEALVEPEPGNGEVGVGIG